MSIYLKRKDRIILTSIEIIDELGFQGLSTKEICKRQKFSEGSLYKHFKSKDEIVLAVLNYYSKFDEDIRQTIEMKNFNSKESIIYYITRFGELYENYPALTAIHNSYEIFRNEAGVSYKIIEIFEFRSNIIKTIIENGIKNNEIKPEMDSENLTDIIMGFTNEIIQKWRLRNYNFKLKERLVSTLNMVVNAL